jgi:chromosome segregation ATPase
MGSFTIALFDALLSIGIPMERARNVVDLFDKSVDERYAIHAPALATRRDLAGCEDRLAREIAEVRADVAQLKIDVAQLKIDVAQLRNEVAQLRSDLEQLGASVRAELHSEIGQLRNELRALVAETRADLIKWTLGALTAQTALILGAIKLF